MLSDSEHKKAKPPMKHRSTVKPAKGNVHWSDKQKMEAVNSYLLLGNLALTARLLNIPEITLRVWKATTWWKDLVAEAKLQEKMELSARVKKLVDASMSVVEDRLANGDFQFDQKTGQIIRKPVNMKDAHKVAVDMQNQRDILEKSEKVEQTEEHVEDKLLKLAEKFADMATKKIEQNQDRQRTVDVEDVEEYDSAIHVQRET
jgi:transposase